MTSPPTTAARGPRTLPAHSTTIPSYSATPPSPPPPPPPTASPAQDVFTSQEQPANKYSRHRFPPPHPHQPPPLPQFPGIPPSKQIKMAAQNHHISPLPPRAHLPFKHILHRHQYTLHHSKLNRKSCPFQDLWSNEYYYATGSSFWEKAKRQAFSSSSSVSSVAMTTVLSASVLTAAAIVAIVEFNNSSDERR